MTSKRFLAWIMALCMVMCMSPVTSFANETATEPSDQQAGTVENVEPAEQSDPAGEDEGVAGEDASQGEVIDENTEESDSEPVFSAKAVSAPTKMWVEPSETNGIPAQIDVFKAGSGNSVIYQLYLPGNANLNNCVLFWDNGATATVGNNTYESGAIETADIITASLSSETTITFKNGDTSLTSWKFITYQGSNSGVQQMFIEIDESQGTIANMKSSKDNTCSGIIYINGQQYVLDKMKGRGNATWDNAVDKKPYNITLGAKIQFPGVNSAETKKWTLLAEVLDRSLLCNRSGYHLAHELGIGQDTTSADVWMNGEYQGCYTVTPKTDSFVTKDGYMIEQDNYQEPAVANGGDPQFELEGLISTVSGWSSAYNVITVKKMGDNLLGKNAEGKVDESPENMEAKAAEIQSWLQDAWDAVRSDTGFNSKGKYYTDYIDIESFAKMYLMHEYVKSYDVCAGSILFHRDGMADANKLIAGPLWDLDNAMGSVYQNSSLGRADDRRNGDRRSAQGSFIQNVTEYKTSIYKTISKHSDFMEEVNFQYNKNKKYFDNLESDVAQMISDIDASATMNHIKVTDIGKIYNGYQTGTNNHYYSSNTNLGSGDYAQTYVKTTSWADYAANLKTYIHTRSAWFASSADGFFDPDFVDPATCDHQYELVTEESAPATCTAAGVAKYKCPICKDTYSETLPKIAHDYQNGACTVCGEQLFNVSIECTEGASVTVFETQDVNGECWENATSANPRDSKSGLIDCSGSGQVNFAVNLAPGYKLGSVTAAPKNYNKLNEVTDAGIPNCYRATKVTGDFTITVTTECAHPNMKEHPAKAATCTEAGNSAYWSCDKCGKFYSDAEGTTEIEENSWVQAALGHDMTKTAAKNATCTEAGNSAYWTCGNCGKFYSDAEGTTEIEENSWVQAALGHDMTKTAAKSATCTEAGNSTYWACENCGKFYSDAEGTTEIEENSWVQTALGHDMTGTAAKNATCTEAGNSAYWTCGNCGKFYSDEEGTTEIKENSWIRAALGHQWKYVGFTWTESGGGYTAVANYQCENDESHTDSVEAQITQSSPDATCTEAGTVTYTATISEGLSLDGTEKTDSRTKEGTPLGHKLTKTAAKAATCTKEGNEEYWTCSRCGNYFAYENGETAIEKDSWIIKTTDHTWTHVVNRAGLLKDGSEYDQCTTCKTIMDKKVLNGYAAYYVKSLKVSKGKKAITVKWKKQSKANQKKFNGYQVRYSTNANMSGAKYATAGKKSKNKKIKKLAKKTRYYVQVRTYTTYKGKTYYSKWSPKKSVVTK